MPDVKLHFTTDARWICLICEPNPNAFYTQVTFCDDPSCYTSSLSTDHSATLSFRHEPTHDFVKVRTMVHRLSWPSLAEKAREALNVVRNGPEKLLPVPKVENPVSSCAATRGFSVCQAAEASLPATSEVSSREASCGDDTIAPTSSGIITEARHERCMVCRNAVYMGQSWFCLDCYGARKTSLSLF